MTPPSMPRKVGWSVPVTAEMLGHRGDSPPLPPSRWDGLRMLVRAAIEWPRLAWSQRERVGETHLSPRGIFSLSGRARCCGRPVLSLPYTDRVTLETRLVTCGVTGAARRRAVRRGRLLRAGEQWRGWRSTPFARRLGWLAVWVAAFMLGAYSTTWTWLS